MAETQQRSKGKFVVQFMIGLLLVGVYIWYREREPEKPQEPATQVSAPSVPAPTRARPVWQYGETKNKVHDRVTKWASLESPATVDLSFPYQGGSIAELSVLRSIEDGKPVQVVRLTISKGQFVCCFIHAKFDDGKAIRFGAQGSVSGKYDTVSIVTGAGDFISHLKRSKEVMIEAEFYKDGAKQIYFETAGLKW